MKEKRLDNILKTPSVKKNFFISTLYEILSIITPFITAPYLSRVLGAEKIGINSFVHSIQAYFIMMALLGTSSYGTREIARVRDNAYERSKTFWEIELLTVFTSLFSLIAWLLFILFTDKYKIYYIILSFGILSAMVNVNWFYSGIEQFKFTVTRNIIVKITGICLIFIFVKTSDDLFKFILLNSICEFLGALSMWFSLRKFVIRIHINELNIFRHFKETLIYFIPAIATSLYTILDKILIGVITNEEKQNGYYEQADKIINMIKVLTFGSLNNVLSARSSYLFAQNKFDEIKEKISLSIDYVMLLGIGCCFGLIGVADKFVPFFFGDGYDQVVILLQIMSPLVIIIGISRTLGAQYYTPSGKRLQSSLYVISGSIVNIILTIFLIPKYKSIGACIGTIIAQITITSLYLFFCNGFLSLKQIIKISYKKVISGFIMLIFLILIKKINTYENLILLIQFFGGIIIYFTFLVLLKDNFIMHFLLPKLKAKIHKGE